MSERRRGDTGHGDARRWGDGEMGRRPDTVRDRVVATHGGFAAVQCGKAPPFRPTGFLSIARLRVALILSAILLSSASAQQIGNPTQQGVAPPRGTYVIRNARIATLSGPEIENGSVVIKDGKIVAVGASVGVPPGAEPIEARGLRIYPGMMDAGTSLGLLEVGQGAAGTVDTAEIGDLNPNAKAIIAVNPHSAHIAVTRVDGVTSVVTLPVGGLISGQAAIINLVGTTPIEMALVPYAALVISYPRVGGRGGEFVGEQQQSTNLSEALATGERQLGQIRRMLRDAEAYGRAQNAYAKDKSLPRPDRQTRISCWKRLVRMCRANVQLFFVPIASRRFAVRSDSPKR